MEMLTSSQQSDIDVVRKSLEEQHHKYTEELRSDLQKALQVSALAPASHPWRGGCEGVLLKGIDTVSDGSWRKIIVHIFLLFFFFFFLTGGVK